MTRYTAQTFPAARALSILTAIQAGEQLPQAPPLFPSKNETPPKMKLTLSWLIFAPPPV